MTKAPFKNAQEEWRGMSRLTCLCVASSVALSTGCSKQPAEKEPVVSVQAVPVRHAQISRTVQAEAVLFPLQQSAITPKVNSPVRKFYVNRGSRVHQGQLLAVLENHDLAAAAQENKGVYEQAQAIYEITTSATVPEEVQKAELDAQQAKEALDAQQKVYESRQDLYKQGAIPRKDVDSASVAYVQAKAQYQVAQKHLASLHSVSKQQELKSAQAQLSSAEGKYLGAEAQLRYSEIRSPIDGVVTDRPVYEGELAPAGQSLMTIMNISKVIAKAHIPQNEAVALKVGDSAKLTNLGLGEAVSGTVSLISPAVDPNSTTLEVWVQVQNTAGALKPGSTVQLAIDAKNVPDALVVPASALLKSSDGKTTVMVIGSDGRAHSQEVQVGIQTADQVQVLSGLQAGQQVVAQGAFGLPDNTKVTVEIAAPKEKGSSETPAEQNKS